MKMREYNPAVGETWISRANNKYTIIEVSTSKDYAVLAIDNKKRLSKFTRDGYFVGKEFPNPNDLVERL